MNSNKSIDAHSYTECGYTNINEPLDLQSFCDCCESYIISDI